MSGEDADDADDAAAAFEALRGEVAHVRRALEGLGRALTGQRTVDYTATLGALDRGLKGLQGRLDRIALGRRVIEGGPNGNMVSTYDAAGQRTRLTWPDGFFVTYSYDQTGAMTAIRESGATTGPGVLSLFGYDEQGRRTSVTRGNGSSTAYAYDGAQLLKSLTQTLPSGQGNTDTFTYNQANQLVGKVQSNDGWAWNGSYNFDRAYVANALNQQTQSGSNTLTWGGKGVLTADGSAGTTYGYDAANQLFSTGGGSHQQYDAEGRIYSVGVSAATRFLYDGKLAVAEYDPSGAMTERYVPGPNVDEPVAWYDANGRKTLMADRLGSVTAVVNDGGGLAALNAYDEYGLPGGGNAGRYQYTGQKYLTEIGLYDYKARNYSPTLGRFLQPDPNGYADGTHIYNYVGSDPVNRIDPTGRDLVDCGMDECFDGGGGSGGAGDGGGSASCPETNCVVVTASPPKAYIPPPGTVLFPPGSLLHPPLVFPPISPDRSNGRNPGPMIGPFNPSCQEIGPEQTAQMGTVGGFSMTGEEGGSGADTTAPGANGTPFLSGSYARVFINSVNGSGANFNRSFDVPANGFTVSYPTPPGGYNVYNKSPMDSADPVPVEVCSKR